LRSVGKEGRERRVYGEDGREGEFTLYSQFELNTDTYNRPSYPT
jgi:hypothetical protein